MPRHLSGTCNCGGVTVELSFDDDHGPRPETVSMCFCLTCRKASGGVASLNIAAPNASAKVHDPKGLVKSFKDESTRSGNVAERFFCSGCGSPIRTISSADPSAAYYKASLFSDFIEGQGARDGGAGGGGLPKPGAVVFEERKPDWLEAKAGK